MRVDDEPLDLTDEMIEQDAAPNDEEYGDEERSDGEEDTDETIITFADEVDADVSENAVIRSLRQQLKNERSRRLQGATALNNHPDPEPDIPARPKSVEDFDWDVERFNSALDAHLAGKDEHSAWKAREEKRLSERTAHEAERGQKFEQQRKALGVRDYEARAALVRDRLSEEQLFHLIDKSDNPAQIIYALGRSESRLDALASEQDIGAFIFKLGQNSKDIKVTKKTAPTPESRVRGASAPMAIGGDKQLEKLEKDAAKTGDRTKLIQYRQSLKNRAA